MLKSFVIEKIFMENQDKDASKSHPNPSDNAQSLVETIIPSSDTEESKTTEVKPLETQKEGKPLEQKKAEKTSWEQNDKSTETGMEDTTDKRAVEKQIDETDEGEKIETVAP